MSRREILAVWALVSFFALDYSLYGLFRHWHFGSSAYDLGIFDQAIWHLSRFEVPASSIRGVVNIFGDHFHPIIGLLVPLYWIWSAPEMLIGAQAVLLGVSIVPVYMFLRDRLAAGPSLTLCAAYGFLWAMQRTAAYDFHEIAFAPLIVATAILAMDRQRWSLLWLASVALMLVKEDLIPLVGFLGLFVALRGEWRRAAMLASASVIAFVLVVRVVIPSLNAAGAYGYSAGYADVLMRPWTIPVALVTPSGKLITVLLWLAPFSFLPLFSPLCVLLAPVALSRLLSDNAAHWGTIFHYSAPLAPILVMSAGDALARLLRRVDAPRSRTHLIRVLTGTSVLLSLFLPGNQPLWDLFQPEHYRQTDSHRAGYRAIQLVPQDASVVAQGAVVPHLSQRKLAYLLDRAAPDADYVITAAGLSSWPYASTSEIAAVLAERYTRGYRVIFEEGGWLVLQRR